MNVVKKIFNPPVHVKTPQVYPIYVFYQFFIHSDKNRYEEIKYTLKKNLKCNYIEKIVLLNEREYTNEEYGITEIEREKIKEIIVGDRLSYRMFFEHAKKYKGYVILCNSDIYFTNTLVNIYQTPLSNSKSCFCNLRLEKNYVFGPRSDSQDSWMFHSDFLPDSKKYDILLGKPGCDNVMIYLLFNDNYTIFNEPFRIQTKHVHSTNIRNYTRDDLIVSKYAWVYPYLSYDIRPNYTELNFEKFMSIIEKKTYLVTHIHKCATQVAMKTTYSYDCMEDIQNIYSLGVQILGQSELYTYQSIYVESLLHSNCFFVDEPLENSTTLKLLNKPYINSNTINKPLERFLKLKEYLNTKRILYILDDQHQIKDSESIIIDSSHHWYTTYMKINEKIKKKDFDVLICFSRKYAGLLNLWCYTAYKYGKSAINIPELYTGFSYFN